MTREEAIDGLLAVKDFCNTPTINEVVNTAIEALKQPEIIYCKDCKFSRQSMIGGELDCCGKIETEEY